ncbi:MAG: type II 3-dehydroquinate dehydratase [Oscillospiraceae bacterium]
MKLLILNGPNLNLLGQREPEIYGSATYHDLLALIQETAQRLGLKADVRQSNHEGDLVDWIQDAYGVYDGIVLNPGAYTHTSIALLDALLAVGIPTVEVHLSDLKTREPFRQISYIRPACAATLPWGWESRGTGGGWSFWRAKSGRNCIHSLPHFDLQAELPLK